MKKILLLALSFLFLSCAGSAALSGIAAEAFGPIITKVAGSVYKKAAEKAVEKVTEKAVEKAVETAAGAVIEKAIDTSEDDESNPEADEDDARIEKESSTKEVSS